MTETIVPGETLVSVETGYVVGSGERHVGIVNKVVSKIPYCIHGVVVELDSGVRGRIRAIYQSDYNPEKLIEHGAREIMDLKIERDLFRKESYEGERELLDMLNELHDPLVLIGTDDEIEKIKASAEWKEKKKQYDKNRGPIEESIQKLYQVRLVLNERVEKKQREWFEICCKENSVINTAIETLEFFLRMIIIEELAEEDNWFEKHFPGESEVNEEDRTKTAAGKREVDNIPYKTPPHLIHYTWIGALRNIIINRKNWDAHFKKIFDDRKKFEEDMEFIMQIRNAPAHARSRFLSDGPKEEFSKIFRDAINRIILTEQRVRKRDWVNASDSKDGTVMRSVDYNGYTHTVFPKVSDNEIQLTNHGKSFFKGMQSMKGNNGINYFPYTKTTPKDLKDPNEISKWQNINIASRLVACLAAEQSAMGKKIHVVQHECTPEETMEDFFFSKITAADIPDTTLGFSNPIELGPVAMACHIANERKLAYLILENIDLARPEIQASLKGFCSNRYRRLNYPFFNCGIREGKNLVIIGTYSYGNPKFWHANSLWDRHSMIVGPYSISDFYEKRKAP